MIYLIFIAKIFFPVALVYFIETISLGWKNSSLRRLIYKKNLSEINDVWFFLMYGTGAFSTIVAIGSFGLGWIVGSEMQKTLSNIAGLHFRFDTGYGGLNFACYYLSFSFIEYWNHRLFHYGIFWNFHRIHHTATAMNPLVEHRNHPIQHALEPLLLAWPEVVPEAWTGTGWC
ncbi:MAG: sterol desaturase family protein [Acidocella sp.]|nr:sterol desaturase family protein [Acidocella sp.]